MTYVITAIQAGKKISTIKNAINRMDETTANENSTALHESFGPTMSDGILDIYRTLDARGYKLAMKRQGLKA